MDKVDDRTNSRLGPNVHPASLCTQVISLWSKDLYTASYKHITENMQRILIMPNIYIYNDTLYLTSKMSTTSELYGIQLQQTPTCTKNRSLQHLIPKHSICVEITFSI